MIVFFAALAVGSVFVLIDMSDIAGVVRESAVYTLCMIGILYAFEEYTHIMMTKRERKITIILSGIYSGIVWILFSRILRRDFHTILFQMTAVALTVMLLELYNITIYEKIKHRGGMLVAGGVTNNIMRMERIAHGARPRFYAECVWNQTKRRSKKS